MIPAEERLLELGLSTGGHDPDAAWNSYMASTNTGRSIWRQPFLSPGEITYLTFSNETDKHVPFVTEVHLAEEWEGPGPSTIRRLLYEQTIDKSQVEIRELTSGMDGYFLTGNGYHDVAVLDLNDFLYDEGQMIDRADIYAFFLEGFVKQKQKLIIDLRQDGGGHVAAAHDIFEVLFPDLKGSQAFREAMRASPGMEAVLTSGLHPFTWPAWTTDDGHPFNNSADVYGPVNINGALYTEEFREVYTVSPPFLAMEEDRPFRSGNIVILSDGACASSCAMLVEFLKVHGRVPSVIIGGRPQQTPMQTVGGTKGGWVAEVGPDVWSNLKQASAGKITPGSFWDHCVGGTYTRPQIAGRINPINQYRHGNGISTPQQFVYEAADCRIWYTPEMVDNPVLLWKRVADIAWGDGQKSKEEFRSQWCVKGSTGHATSISGGWKSDTLGPQTPPKGTKWSKSLLQWED